MLSMVTFERYFGSSCVILLHSTISSNTQYTHTDTMKHPCATKIHIKESILRVEIHSVLTIQRDENGVDFEFDVGCTIVQTLNLDTFVYSRKVLFDFFEYADDTDKLTKKRQKKLQTPIECSMVPISFKENKHELETRDGYPDRRWRCYIHKVLIPSRQTSYLCLYHRMCGVCLFLFVCMYINIYMQT